MTTTAIITTCAFLFGIIAAYHIGRCEGYRASHQRCKEIIEELQELYVHRQNLP